MPSVRWMQAVALQALKNTEYRDRAHTIPFNPSELQRVQFSLHHSPLMSVRLMLDCEASLNRFKSHLNCLAAYEAVTDLCKRLRIKHR